MTRPEPERVATPGEPLPPVPESYYPGVSVKLKAPRKPVAPKAYGALGGAGTGAAIAAIIVGLIQDYVTHGPLSAPAIQAIYAVVPVLLAFAGAWLAPHQARPAARLMAPPGTASPEVRAAAEWYRRYIQETYGGEPPAAPPAAPEAKDS